MTSEHIEELNSCWNQVKGGKGSRFDVLDSGGRDQYGGHGMKRQRHSTGGASTDLTYNQSQSMKLSLEKFKDLDTDTKLENIFECLQSIKLTSDTRLDKIEHSVGSLHTQVSDTHEQLKLLRYKSIDAEARSRRSNLIFRGIPETMGEDPIGKIKSLLCEQLELDSEIFIQRAHRIGRTERRWGPNIKHRPIIANFRDYHDVEQIISNAYKLRGSGIGINKDLPAELLDARKPLWAKLKSIKAQNKQAKVVIAYPAKLILNGRVIADSLPDWQKVMSQRRAHFEWQQPDNLHKPMQQSTTMPPVDMDQGRVEDADDAISPQTVAWPQMRETNRPALGDGERRQSTPKRVLPPLQENSIQPCVTVNETTTYTTYIDSTQCIASSAAARDKDKHGGAIGGSAPT